MNNKLIILLSFMCSIGFTTNDKTRPAVIFTRWVVTENSSLRVTGSTNLSKFTCDITGYNNPDTIHVTDNNQTIRLTGSVNLDVSEFNCHNPMMTKELRKTLQSKEYPTLCIDFLSLSMMPQFTYSTCHLTGVVVIHLAGKSKRYTINYEVSKASDKTFRLDGRREIYFSDFDLKAPKKAGGIISARDKLLVQFTLNLKSI